MGVGAPAHRSILQATSVYCHVSRAGVPRSIVSNVWVNFYVDFACVFGQFCVRIRQKLENIGDGADAKLQLLVPASVHPGAQLHQFSCPNSVAEMICVFVRVHVSNFVPESTHFGTLVVIFVKNYILSQIPVPW